MRQKLFSLSRYGREDMWRRFKQANDRRVAERLHAILLLDSGQNEARAKIAAVICALEWPAETAVYMCFAHPQSPEPRYNDPERVRRRKPSGAMLHEAIATFPLEAATGVLYVGDSAEDEQAATDAGVPFMWAHEFFGDGR